ncbi:MAG: TnsA endonuclease N-terminal domain-containing protein [Acidovorax sp.]|uniref:TnsA endonuclease N-terminal domain-containing protein n=1 Tax=Acidovorax sp. TaxID=1872122 RepID=UPI0025BFB8E8|nr:TnsA endonuclease N-terminal domain-containing protein [Acidovorax sp.]MCE1194531.1 TnsA endonuclease N-terminal domain-containing protein [Acidovorax sp.]
MSKKQQAAALDQSGAAPVTRTVVTRSPGHTVRSIHLPHLQPKPIEADSSLERDFVYLTIAFPFLRTITHQPFQLSLAAGGYTPDFLVYFKDGSRVAVEVKPESQMEGFAEKLAQAKAQLAEREIEFLVAHDTLLRRDGIEERAKRIRRYAKGKYPASEQELVIQSLQSSPRGLSFKFLASLGVQKTTILHMVSHQKLQVSSRLDIEDDALVQLPITLNEEGSHAIRFANWLNA